LFRELAKYNIVKSGGWHHINSSELTPHFRDSPAQVKDLWKRGSITPLDILCDVFFTWLKKEVLPVWNENMAIKMDQVSEGSKRHYSYITEEAMQCWYLKRLIHGLIKKEKHDLHPSTLESLCDTLLPKHRYDALSAGLTFGVEQLKRIVSSISPHMHHFIAVGSLSCVDEAMFPFYSEQAKKDGVLRHVPNKPNDYGLLTYGLVQRLLFSNLPILLDAEPTWLGQAPTPFEALCHMVERNKSSHFHSLFIADSLWSVPSYIQLFGHLTASFIVAMKEGANSYGKEVLTIAERDLPSGTTRTYHKAPYTIQVHHLKDHVTSVLSNAWRTQSPEAAPKPCILKYDTAVYLFQHETPASLRLAFKIDDPLVPNESAAIIKAATGWDVAKLIEEQHFGQPLTEKQAMYKTKAVLQHLYETKFKKKPPSDWTKKDLVAALYPNSQEISGTKSKERSRDNREMIFALRQELCGKVESVSPLYDQWTAYWNSLDRLDYLYSLFYDSAGHETYQKQGLESLAFQIVLSAYSIYTELSLRHAYEHSGNNKSVIEETDKLTVPQFIVKAAEAWVARYQ
jgi:hypothetical protein